MSTHTEAAEAPGPTHTGDAPVVNSSQEDSRIQNQVPEPHRSHDPATNLKRSDPFQFGSRLLEAGDDVFEFNAWDHVETDDAYKEYAERQIELQRQSPVSEFDKSSWPLSLFSFSPCLIP